MRYGRFAHLKECAADLPPLPSMQMMASSWNIENEDETGGAVLQHLLQANARIEAQATALRDAQARLEAQEATIRHLAHEHELLKHRALTAEASLRTVQQGFAFAPAFVSRRDASAIDEPATARSEELQKLGECQASLLKAEAGRRDAEADAHKARDQSAEAHRRLAEATEHISALQSQVDTRSSEQASLRRRVDELERGRRMCAAFEQLTYARHARQLSGDTEEAERVIMTHGCSDGERSARCSSRRSTVTRRLRSSAVRSYISRELRCSKRCFGSKARPNESHYPPLGLAPLNHRAALAEMRACMWHEPRHSGRGR